MKNQIHLIEHTFENDNNRQRLLGNLLVLARYVNTLRQGLAQKGNELSLGLQKAVTLLWDCLEGNANPADAADFSNHLYDCYYIDSVGVREELPEPFYTEHFGKGRPCAYEWMALEWAAGLLMQLVLIAGGRLDFDDFEDCKYVDFYGVNLLMDQLEEIAKAGVLPPISGTVQAVLGDLQRAKEAGPETFAQLRREYQNYTIVPEEYAGNLLEY